MHKQLLLASPTPFHCQPRCTRLPSAQLLLLLVWPLYCIISTEDGGNNTESLAIRAFGFLQNRHAFLHSCCPIPSPQIHNPVFNSKCIPNLFGVNLKTSVWLCVHAICPFMRISVPIYSTLYPLLKQAPLPLFSIYCYLETLFGGGGDGGGIVGIVGIVGTGGTDNWGRV